MMPGLPAAARLSESSTVPVTISPWQRHVPHISVDVPIFCFAIFLHVFSSAVAWSLNLAGIPFLYLEPLAFAPFLHLRIGRILIVISCLVALSRVVEGWLGGDQLFVAVYMLVLNLPGFPWPFRVAVVSALIGAVALVVLPAWLLPVRRRPVRMWIPLVLLVVIVTGKITEVHTKRNLVGTSFGYLLGQFRFSSMLWSHYRVPYALGANDPAWAGARFALDKHTSYLLIVVESMGTPQDQTLHDEMFRGFAQPSVTRQYAVQQGELHVVGSTIHGEIRSLCGGALEHGLLGDSAHNCLPGIFADHGYRVTAVHANKPGMYGRDHWYPRVGFQAYINSSTPQLPGHPLTSWWGTSLDPDSIRWITQHYFHSAPRDFVYWLTLSTHIPVKLLPGAQVPSTCPRTGTFEACVHIANLQNVMDATARAVASLPNTTVVIVGDHAPPFATPGSRAMFHKDAVPYLVLTPR